MIDAPFLALRAAAQGWRFELEGVGIAMPKESDPLLHGSDEACLNVVVRGCDGDELTLLARLARRGARVLHACEIPQLDALVMLVDVDPEEHAGTVLRALDLARRCVRGSIARVNVEDRFGLDALQLAVVHARHVYAERVAATNPDWLAERDTWRVLSRARWEWIRRLAGRDDTSSYLLHRWKQREDALGQALFEDGGDEFHPLLRPRRGARVGDAQDADITDHVKKHLNVLESAVLPRYDLALARRQLGGLLQLCMENDPEPRTGYALAGLVLRLAHPCVAFVAVSATFVAFVPGNPVGEFLIGLVLLVAVLGIPLLLLVSLLTQLPVSYVFLPRLWAGILVGQLVVVALPDRITNRFLDAHELLPLWSTAAFFAVAMAVGLLYLYGEVSRKLLPWRDVGPRVRLRRAFEVWIVGVLGAVVAGVVLCALIAGPVLVDDGAVPVAGAPPATAAATPERDLDRIVRPTTAISVPLLPRVFVVLQYVLFTASMSFLAGIVLQMLWEEKATTEPPV